MNIVIDQGNTSAKIAIFDRQKMLASFIFKPLKVDNLIELLNKFSPLRGILSCVADFSPELIYILKNRLSQFIILDEDVALPIRIEYRTPNTLGKDRIAAVIGAWKKASGQDILVIDAGTAITYDFVHSSGVYKGGNISPGMTIRFKSLHAFTDRLPMLDENGELPEMGYNTETAIRSGVIGGIVKEMDAYIEEFRMTYPQLLVFLTGGHSFYFERKLKNSIFADGNLVLQGLNDILNFNK